MSKREITVGSTSQTIDVFIQDSSVSTGAGLTGLVYNTASLTAYYRKGATGTPTAITLATQTVGGAYSSGGFVAVDGTNCPGQYRLDLPNAALDTAGMVTVYLRGATNMAPCVMEIEVVAVNKFDAVRMGLTAIPNVAQGSTGSIPVSVDTAGRVDVLKINGTSQTARDIGASVLLSNGTGTGQISLSSGGVSVASVGADAISNTSIANTAIRAEHFLAGAIDANALATDAASEIAGAVWDVSIAGHATAGTTGLALSDVLADTGTDGVLVSSGTAAGQISLTSGVVLARDHEGDEIAKATNLATLISRVGSFTATGVNTVLGMFKALLSKTATLPSDVGGTFDPATDSTEALRDRGDAAWTTGTTPPTAAAIRAEIDANSTKLDVATSTRLAAASYSAPPSAASIADAVTDEAVSDHTTAGTVGAQLASIYAAQIDFSDDEANTQDEYSVQWFKNGAPVTSGITSPTIQVIKRSDGTDLIASGTAMTQIGSTGAYKYDATEEANRLSAGEAVLVQVSATIDGSARTWRKVISRDSAAA